VDDGGRGLKEEYNKNIMTEMSRGRLKLIYVRNIFSEDASPLLNSGISSIVFPSLISQSFYEVDEFKRNGFVGAGLWFIDSMSHLRRDYPSLNGVRGIIDTSVHSGILYSTIHQSDFFNEIINEGAERIIDWAGDFNIFDIESTKKLVYDRIASKKKSIDSKMDISSSHVLRIDLKQSIRASLVKKINRL